MSTAFASGIRIASNPPSPSFTTMQAAIDAAQDGDVLLVQPGTYGAATLDGKSLSIVAMPTGTPHMAGLSVINVNGAQKVLVVGMTMDAVTTAGVTLLNDAGDVRFQNCVFHGGRTAVSGAQGIDYFGLPGIDVQSCARVVLSNCQSTGGNAVANEGDNGQDGGHGIAAQGSNLVLYEGTYRGGNGSEITNPGGSGGDGCHVQGFGFFASGSTFTGGTAGRSDYLGCNYGGAGGDGIDATDAQAQVLGVVLQPAGAGYSTCGSAWFGPAGVPIRNTGGFVHTIPGTNRTLRALAFASDASHFHITVTGQPGERFYLARSFETGFAFENAYHGAWMLSPAGREVARAVIPASGVLTMQVRTTGISGDPQTMVLQGWCFDAANQAFLTGPIHIELFDAAGGPDCNANGANDYIDVLGGGDVNQNSIPDGCSGG